MRTPCEIVSSFRDEANHVMSFGHQLGQEKCPTDRQQDRRMKDMSMIRVGFALRIFRIRDIFLIGMNWISENRDSGGMRKVSDAIVKL
jgi:hypothetical protein